MDYRIISAIGAMLLAVALSIAAHAKAIADAAFSFFLLALFLFSTPLALLAAFIFAVLSGTLVVFAAFHLNYVFQKRLVESASEKDGEND